MVRIFLRLTQVVLLRPSLGPFYYFLIKIIQRRTLRCFLYDLWKFHVIRGILLDLLLLLRSGVYLDIHRVHTGFADLWRALYIRQIDHPLTAHTALWRGWVSPLHLIFFFELLVEPVKFLHFLNALSIFFFGTQFLATTLLNDSLPLDLWRLAGGAYLIYNVRVDVVL